MGFRFRKSIKIAPGIKLNFNTKSTSVTFGKRGLHHTISSSGRRTTSVGIPGTGISYSTTQSPKKINTSSQVLSSPTGNAVKPRKHGCLTSIVIFLAFCLLLAAFSEPDNTSYVASTESETEFETESELMLTPSTTMYATTALNIRSGPGTEYAVLSTLQAGESLSVINQTDGWSEIEYNSGSAYVATKYITDNYKPVETNNSAPSEPMVWIPYSGSKYHRTSSCSGMKGPTQVTLSEAQQRGYTPCKKCY